ncbi:ornithine carbamoyltransferase [Craterilacuibacter sinensis]|uniref:Ornithine carbamoyltransferase n=1 Tax=Craterilacuibacter sinensis TaxID=2686017 RepID=A0A845BJX5_9NEIS|nr:ornithine carbamoyltransferase [Craterilacuibacter sinensis]MXR35558.1 ornithine carbamoyltransferase [Craterilacuibacter sinensis]RQW28799.1 ornithine carbamoyltransferase [Rhodobacteraceae bacterium CH30]
MAFNLKGRHFLKELDFTPREIKYMLDLARDLKRAKYAGNEEQRMVGKNIALIFEKTSTRTRCSFEVAAHDQGAHVTYIDPSSSQLGHKESIADTARVLSRFYDGIEFRGFAQDDVEELAKYSCVPVFNGLTDEWHPTQMLCDVMTMTENCDKPMSQIAYAYVGDAHNNMGHSLMVIGCMMGMDVRIGGPKGLEPDAELVKQCHEIAKQTGARLTVTNDPKVAVKGADFIHTDVWVSMGEPIERWGERIALLKPFRVDAALMAASGNPNIKFMHCLPAFHNTKTKVGKQIAAQYPEFADGIEVTDEVFESPVCLAFEQAENRMHTIKAIMVATIGS